METTVRLGLPLLMAGQAQKEVTHNEALAAVDRLLALAVQSRSQATPPAAPMPGATFIVPSGAAAWAAPAGTLMTWDGHGWIAIDAPAGTSAFIVDEGSTSLRTPAGWSTGWPVGGLTIAGRAVLAAAPTAVPLPSGGAVIDIEARAGMAALVVALRAQGIVM